MDVPEPPPTDVGLNDRVSPETGATLSDTVPVKPPRGAIEIVEVFVDPPEVTVRLVGLAEIVKSGAGTVRVSPVPPHTLRPLLFPSVSVNVTWK